MEKSEESLSKINAYSPTRLDQNYQLQSQIDDSPVKQPPILISKR